MQWWYFALLDEMVKNPTVSVAALARHFKVSTVTINMVVSSDMFRANLETRMKNNSQYLDEAIRAQMARNALRGLELQAKILETKQQTIPLPELTSTVDKTLERLGYGVKSNGGVTVNATGQTQVVVPVSLGDLEAARAALRQTEMAKGIEHDANGKLDNRHLISVGDNG